MYKAIAANKRNTILIMAVFIGIISAIGYLVSLYYNNTSVVYWVVIGVAIYTLIQYFAASKLAVMITGARQIEKRDNPRLYRVIENLVITTGLPMPKVYIIDDPAANAFATGRNPQNAIIAATTGLLDIMNDTELEAIMAHEMSHVQNYDIRVSMITFGLTSAIGLLADVILRMFFYGNNRRSNDTNPVMLVVGIFVVILAPIIAAIIQMAISRQREYLADASGSLTTRHPEALVSALEKLKQYKRPMKRQNTAAAHLFFSNPLKAGFFSKLFSTHPPLEDRIARLRANTGKF
jgi:heat shock protein HtpX